MSGGDSARFLAPVHAFGLQNDVQNNVIAVDESTVIHPVGRAIALYNTDSHKMAFIRDGTQDKGEMTALALAPSKKYLAVCERAETAQISIYHVASQKRTKVLPTATSPLEGSESDHFVTAAFSADSKLLAAVTGDFCLVLWLWDKGRLLAMQKSITLPPPTNGPAAVSRVSFNPTDGNMLATSGTRLLKLWRVTDGTLRSWKDMTKGKEARSCTATNPNPNPDPNPNPNPSPNPGKEAPSFTDHVWLPGGDDRIGACTDGGEVHMVEKGEVRNVLTSARDQGATNLLCICAFARGFVTAGKEGILCIYEASKVRVMARVGVGVEVGVGVRVRGEGER